MSMGERKLPIVYSCSGCSSVAQMANYIAICLDRGGHAEMSCIAGVGGDVPSLVRVAKSGRPVVALDGFPLALELSIGTLVRLAGRSEVATSATRTDEGVAWERERRDS